MPLLELPRRCVVSAIFLTILLVLAVPAAHAQKVKPQPAAPAGVATKKLPARAPLAFEPNQGQAAAEARFVARTSGYGVLITESGDAIFSLSGRRSVPASRFELVESLGQPHAALGPSAVLRLSLSGAAPMPIAEALEPLGSTSSYFRGMDGAGGKTNIPNFGRVVYRDVYPGISLSYSGTRSQLRTTFDIAAGADAARVRLRFSRAQKISITPDGELIVELGSDYAPMNFSAPMVTQAGSKTSGRVRAAFRLNGENEVSLSVAGHDPRLPLAISTISAEERGLDSVTSVALDSAGNIYLAGYTSAMNFPSVNAIKSGIALNDQDTFVTKLSADGTTVLFSTYFGGSGDDYGLAMAVTSDGKVLVGGMTYSTDLPTVNAIQPNFGGSQVDGFLVKLDPVAATVLMCTYLSGSSSEQLIDIALDGDDFIYLTGYTSSPNFPFTVPPAAPYQGSIFVMKLNPAASSIVFSTYPGTPETPGVGVGYAIALPRGCARNCEVFVGGYTNAANFPVTAGAIQTTVRGGFDGFVFRLSATGDSLLYSTYLGGDGGYGDLILDIAVDALGYAFVTGRTESKSFPTTPGTFQTLPGAATCSSPPCFDGFVARINPSGSALAYSTLVGGQNMDWMNAIEIDGEGNAYVAGISNSPFPTTPGVYQPFHAGSTFCGGSACHDAILVKLDPVGSSLLFSTFLGGTLSDQASAIALDAQRNVVIAGLTLSTDLPVRNPAQASYGGGFMDGFVAKLNSDATDLIFSSYFGGNGDAADVTVFPGIFTQVPRVGDQVVFEVHLKNLGPTPARNVRVVIPKPTGIPVTEFRLSSVHAVPCTGTDAITCELAEVFPGLEFILLVGFRAQGEGTVTVTASVTNTVPDFDLSNNASSQQAVVGPALPPVVADMTITSSASKMKPNVGEEVRFTITVVNNGPDKVNAMADIVIPSGLKYVRHVLSTGFCSFNFPPDFTCSFSDLTSGASATVVIYTTPTTAGAFTVPGHVRVGAGIIEPNPANNDTSTTINAIQPSSAGRGRYRGR